MKTLFALFLLTASAALAQTTTFPGLKIVMSPEDFAKAGLAALTPEQLELIDAAIVRHYTETVQTAATQQAEQISQQAIEEEHKAGLLSRMGLPDFSGDWRDRPILKAHCTGWVGGNSFKLDNGQVWEGLETITFELANREVEIQPRPGGSFALTVDGKNTTIRVTRIK